MANKITSIGVGKLTSTARYVDKFLVEIYSDSGYTTKVSQGTSNVRWDGTQWTQKDYIEFDGLIFGNTYYLRAATIAPVSGVLSSWTNFTATPSVPSAPSCTYSGTFTSTTSGVTFLVTPASIPSDIDHYEAVWTVDGSTPASTIQPYWRGGLPNSTQFQFGCVGTPGTVFTVFVRAINTSTQAQAWQSLGAYTVSNSFSGTITGTIAGVPAQLLAMTGVTIFNETFDTWTTANIPNNYTVVNPATGATITANGQMGGNAFQTGTGVAAPWLVFPNNLPFDPTKLYRMRAKVRKTAGANGTACYIGVEGVAADGTTLVNTSGSNSHGAQHYICASGDDPGVSSTWTTYTGFFKGWAATGGAARSTNPNTPNALQTNVRYMRPLFILSYNAAGDTWEIDSLTIDVLPDNLDQVADGSTFIRLGYVSSDNTLHVSTALNSQGSLQQYSIPTGFLSYSSSVDYISFSWSATTVTRPDGSTFSLAALSTYAKPASPTVTTVASGSLAARTRTVGVALVKDGWVYGSSPVVTNVSIAASHVIQIASPSSVAGYDGWIPLVGPDPADTFGYVVADPGSPVAFGTAWTEPSTGYVIFDSGVTISANTNNCIAVGLATNTAYFQYPYINFTNSVMGFGARAQTSASDTLVLKQITDGNHSLNNGNFLHLGTTASGSGSGSGGGGGGKGTQ